MLEKTGMLELTPAELEKVKKEKQLPERLQQSWDLQPKELDEMVKAGEYRVIETKD
jgi:hypothetical protein